MNIQAVLGIYATALLGIAVSTESGATVMPGGDVGGQTWTTAGSPYVIQGDIAIPVGRP